MELLRNQDGLLGLQVQRGISLHPPGDAVMAVLTAGVLVSLALIPTATLIGMGLVAWDVQVVGRAALRWLIDLALVALMAVPVLVWHGSRVGRRTSML